MLKILSQIHDRGIYILAKSSPEQYSNSKVKTKEITEEIKPVGEYENAITVFDDVSGTSDSRDIYQFFTRGRHNKLDT